MPADERRAEKLRKKEIDGNGNWQAADDIDGVPVNLSIYSGKVTLIVNVASQ